MKASKEMLLAQVIESSRQYADYIQDTYDELLTKYEVNDSEHHFQLRIDISDNFLLETFAIKDGCEPKSLFKDAADLTKRNMKH